MFIVAFILAVVTPLGLHAAHWWSKAQPSSWATADWSSTGTLAPALSDRPAMIRIYSARTGRWKGVFATHSWIVLKEQSASAYERWDKVGWGLPVRRNNYAPDGRWYGNNPRVVHEVRGPEAERLIPKIRAGIAGYTYNSRGDYRVWPGPNSNTFIASALADIPEFAAVLPPTAIGKDFPLQGRWFSVVPSRTGFSISLGGYVGLTIAWVEGLEFNILGAVVGIDFRHPALKIPGFGRIGI